MREPERKDQIAKPAAPQEFAPEMVLTSEHYLLVGMRNLVVVRWLTQHPPAVSEVIRHVRERHHKLGCTLIYLSVTDSQTDPSTPEFRKRLIDMVDEGLLYCRVIYAVDIATGFKASLMRSALSSMILLAGRRGRVVVLRDLEDFFTRAGPQLEESKELILQRLVAGGILSEE